MNHITDAVCEGQCAPVQLMELRVAASTLPTHAQIMTLSK